MNWIGALLLVIATTLIGFERAAQLKKRPTQIIQLRMALQIMEAEMVYSQQLLADVCTSISKQMKKPLNSFFLAIAEKITTNPDLSELWSIELDHLAVHSALDKEELTILKQFGQTLGHFDLINQQKQIQLAIVHLDRLLIEAQENHSVLSKVYRGMGILSGILIALILI